MKVLMIPLVPFRRNGISSVICNIVNNIDNEAFDVNIVAINKPDNEYCQTVNAHIYSIIRGKTKLFQYCYNLYKLIKKEKYDIVHIHGNSHTLAFELLIAKLAGCKKRIVHSHNTTCVYKLMNYMLTPLFNHLYTGALACGKDAGIWMFGKKNFTIINNGIDTERFAFNLAARKELRRKLCIQENEILICHVGCFNKQKNQNFLIEIFELLCKKDPDKYKLLLIGTGDLIDEIKKKVNSSEIYSKVAFLGGINNVNLYLSASDLIVMPSLYEGFPVTLVEEQANGLPCVVSDNISEDVNITGEVTFIPLNNNPKQWVEAIERQKIIGDREEKSAESIAKIVKAGLDMKHEIKKLEKYYKEMS